MAYVAGVFLIAQIALIVAQFVLIGRRISSRKTSSNVSPHRLNVNHAELEERLGILDRIQPRAFPFSIFLQPKLRGDINNKFGNDTIKAGRILPCFHPDPEGGKHAKTMNTGLLFCKPTKVAGSTAAGVHLRIARNAADRQHRNFPICRNQWQHGPVRKRFSNRIKTKSLLWTILRDPTRRLVSLFYHFHVSRRGVKATAANFRKIILQEEKQKRSMYLDWVSFVRGSNHTAMIESILYDYDFVAVTERMDESIVALAILWGIPLADVLYFSAKSPEKNGGYDGGGAGACFPILKGEIVPGMQEVIDSEEFQSMIRWDRIAHQLANRSLDKTIDETIGRERFNHVYARFRHAMKVAQERCEPEVIAPCTGGGIFHHKSSSPLVLPQEDDDERNTTWHQFLGQARREESTDCLARDSGCGYMCLDDVATELDLWDWAPPMQYRFPRAFGLGPSSRERLKAKAHADG